MASKILKCFCESEFQDKEYGHFMRLHTLTNKDNTWRCTICRKEQSSGGGSTTKKAKKPAAKKESKANE
jgi:hypothetical protein